MENLVKVVMLPTEDIHAPIGLVEEGTIHENCHLVDSQHLYIAASQDVEKPKKGDWCTYAHPTTPNRVMVTQIENWNHSENDSSYAVRHTEGYGVKEGYRKIIATTDILLVKDDEYTDHVPQVQQSFLKEFAANPDGKWEIEYVDWNDTKDARPFKPYLKLNQDNTVNLSLVEEKMYSRGDLLKTWNAAREVTTCDGPYDIMDSLEFSRGNLSDPIAKYNFNNWIKENL